MRTSQPAASAASTMCEPMRPAPPVTSAVRATLHHGCHDAMVPSRSLRHDAARLARLRCARAAGSPRDEGVLTRLHRQPVGAPEGPGQVGAGIVDARLAPGLAVVVAELDILDTAVAGKGPAANDGHAAGCEGLDEAIVTTAHPARAEDVGTGRDDEVRPPSLLLVEPPGVVVDNLDARHPLDILFAIEPRHDDARRISVALWQRLAVHGKGDDGGRVHRFLEGEAVGVGVCSIKEDFQRTVQWTR